MNEFTNLEKIKLLKILNKTETKFNTFQFKGVKIDLLHPKIEYEVCESDWPGLTEHEINEVFNNNV